MLLIGKNRWMNGGAPTRCARCSESFDGQAYKGQDGKYYCTPDCREWAEEGSVEKRARKLM